MMTQPVDWVPMRWHSGPLESKPAQGGITNEARLALERWHDPSSLSILHGTPVNCLVVTWAEGRPEDAEQQKTLAPLLAEAKRKHLNLLGWVGEKADERQAAEAAKRAGLAGILSAAKPAGVSGVVRIPAASEDGAPWDTESAIVAITDRSFPKVRMAREGGQTADAGPTGKPWVDANGWYLRLAGGFAPSKLVWLTFAPPKAPEVVRTGDYQLAVTETAVYGGRWVIALDDRLRHGLSSGNAEAINAWKSIAQAADFFEKKKDWRTLKAHANLGVISRFAGDSAFLGPEILNLGARDQITFRVIPRETALNAPVKDLKSVIFADFDAPEPALRDKLLEFAEQGGILIVPDVWKDVPGQPEERQNYHRFQVRRFGKGRIALGTEEWSDPWVVSLDAHLLTSYRSDPFRFFNAISSNAHYTVSEDGRKAVLHMINYATRESAGDVSLQIAGKPRSARLWTFSGQPVTLRGAEARNATEFSLPPFSVYAAVELEM